MKKLGIWIIIIITNICYAKGTQDYYTQFKTIFNNTYNQKSFKVKLKIETTLKEKNFLSCDIENSIINPDRKKYKGKAAIGEVKFEFETVLIGKECFERYKTNKEWGNWRKINIKDSKKELFDEKKVINDVIKDATFISKKEEVIEFKIEKEKLRGKIYIDSKKNILKRFIVKSEGKTPKMSTIDIHYFDVNSKNIKIEKPKIVTTQNSEE